MDRFFYLYLEITRTFPLRICKLSRKLLRPNPFLEKIIKNSGMVQFAETNPVPPTTQCHSLLEE